MIRAVWWILGVTTVVSAKGAHSPSGGGALYELGRQLFEDYAPAEVRAQYEFPSESQWNDFAGRLEGALQGGSLEELAAYGEEARAASLTLRTTGAYDDLADWLEPHVDETAGAREVAAAPAPPVAGAFRVPLGSGLGVPHYALWLGRVRDRPVPSRAEKLLPGVNRAFLAEGIPTELVWIAEAESSFNPAARSPVGARGLFQFMPETAREMGLETSLPDERTDPDKSARAAARYLRRLYGRFGDWPLVLAAYNAGQGRVSRLLESRGARDFAGVADALPAETRMYVPKVLALVTLRSGLTPEQIGAPSVKPLGDGP